MAHIRATREASAKASRIRSRIGFAAIESEKASLIQHVELIADSH
jgi:hypothetical protein